MFFLTDVCLRFFFLILISDFYVNIKDFLPKAHLRYSIHIDDIKFRVIFASVAPALAMPEVVFQVDRGRAMEGCIGACP